MYTVGINNCFVKFLSPNTDVYDYDRQLVGTTAKFGSKRYTLCLKKGPTLKLSVTLSNLNRFSKFLHYWKESKIRYKTIQNYPPHLRHVATLPWEIKNSNFLQMWKKMQKSAFLIASNFVILPQIVIFLVFKIASLSSY